MSQYSIVTIGDPILLRVAEPWDFKKDGSPEDLVTGMIRVAREANGVGLAAPQIGISKRVFVVHLRQDSSAPIWAAFINPSVEPQDLLVTQENEGCLSIPNVVVPVQRFQKIKVQYQDINGFHMLMYPQGYNARIVQHEQDHLDGILITDVWKHKRLELPTPF